MLTSASDEHSAPRRLANSWCHLHQTLTPGVYRSNTTASDALASTSPQYSLNRHWHHVSLARAIDAPMHLASTTLLGFSTRRWVQRPTPAKPASITWFSAENSSATSPLLPTSGVKENEHFISTRTPESHLVSSAGGREDPKPLSTAQTPSPSQMCQHQQVFTTLCTCVSIFTIIFLKELATQLVTPLDPSIYAKLDRSSGTRWPICKQVCPS
jgi:hypothetical protein